LTDKTELQYTTSSETSAENLHFVALPEKWWKHFKRTKNNQYVQQ